MKINVLLIGAVIFFLLGCSHVTFPALNDVTRAEIRSSQNELVRQFSDPKQVQALVSFINARRTRWGTPWYGVPVPNLVVNLYTQDRFLGHFGCGDNFFETQRDSRGFFSRDAAPDEIGEFKLLVGFNN